MIAELQTGLNGDPVRSLPINALPTSKNGWPFRPFQIVSLFEMLGTYGRAFYQVGRVIEQLSALPTIGTADQETVTDRLKKLGNMCRAVGLEQSALNVDSLLALPPESFVPSLLKARFPELHRLVENELKSVWFLHIPNLLVNYYDQSASALFGEAVAEGFPSAIGDIEEAGRCLALGRNTACVLHLMLVLQVGLNSLAKELNVAFERVNWDKVITDVETQIKLIEHGSLRQGPAWGSDKTFFAEAALQFRHFKDAWRNHAAHGRMHYDHPDKALSVYTHVREFMQHIAVRLKE